MIPGTTKIPPIITKILALGFTESRKMRIERLKNQINLFYDPLCHHLSQIRGIVDHTGNIQEIFEEQYFNKPLSPLQRKEGNQTFDTCNQYTDDIVSHNGQIIELFENNLEQVDSDDEVALEKFLFECRRIDERDSHPLPHRIVMDLDLPAFYRSDFHDQFAKKLKQKQDELKKYEIWWIWRWFGSIWRSIQRRISQ